MIIGLFIFFEVVMIGFFITSFFTHQEIFWGITLLLSGVLMVTSYSVEIVGYEFNSTFSAYAPVVTSYSYPYLMGLNMLFFILALILGLYDIFDKYGAKAIIRREDEKQEQDEFRLSNNPTFKEGYKKESKNGPGK